MRLPACLGRQDCLTLLKHKGTPHSDTIRLLTCRVLLGLAADPEVAQVGCTQMWTKGAGVGVSCCASAVPALLLPCQALLLAGLWHVVPPPPTPSTAPAPS